MKRYLLITIAVISSASPALAGDVYLLQAHAEGPAVFDPAVDGSEIVEWSSDAFFFNQTSADAQVRLADDLAGVEFTVPPHQSVSLSTVLAKMAVPGRPIGIVHATVPDGVIVEGALFVGEVMTGVTPKAPEYPYGKVRLPVYTSLTPPNQAQVHLGTFLAAQESHTNVWIYNGGTATAAAHIELHRQCDNAVVSETTVHVQPKAIAIVSDLAADLRGCAIDEFMAQWTPRSLYTIVTVDQPSLSFVSAVANDQIPRAMVSVN